MAVGLAVIWISPWRFSASELQDLLSVIVKPSQTKWPAALGNRESGSYSRASSSCIWLLTNAMRFLQKSGCVESPLEDAALGMETDSVLRHLAVVESQVNQGDRVTRHGIVLTYGGLDLCLGPGLSGTHRWAWRQRRHQSFRRLDGLLRTDGRRQGRRSGGAVRHQLALSADAAQDGGRQRRRLGDDAYGCRRWRLVALVGHVLFLAQGHARAERPAHGRGLARQSTRPGHTHTG